MDDAGIIALFNARDERSLEETAAAYGPWCRAIAMNLLGVREDAEECVSDALHALWRRIPPESPVSLRVYLGRIVRNIAVSRRRERDAQKRGGGQLELLMSELGECVPDGFDVEAEVERAVQATVDAHQVKASLEAQERARIQQAMQAAARRRGEDAPEEVR